MLAPAPVLSCLAAAVGLGLSTALVSGPPDALRLAGGVVFLLAVPAFAVGVDVYRLLLVEQSRADVLRAARLRREGVIALRPASEPSGQLAARERVVALSGARRRDLFWALFAARPRP